MKKLAILLALLMVVAAIAPAAAMAPEAGKTAYVVIMAADPVVAYEGGVDGLQATKPAKGEKINPNSALVKKYEKFLEKRTPQGPGGRWRQPECHNP